MSEPTIETVTAELTTARETNATLTQSVEGLTAERDALKAERTNLAASVESLTGERNTAAATVDAWTGTLVEVHQRPLMDRLIDPVAASVLPSPEIDPATGKITEASASALAAFAEQHAALFKPAEAPATPPETPAAPPVVSTPVVDPGGNEITRAYWDKLRTESPREWRSRETQKRYLAWCAANPTK